MPFPAYTRSTLLANRVFLLGAAVYMREWGSLVPDSAFLLLLHGKGVTRPCRYGISETIRVVRGRDRGSTGDCEFVGDTNGRQSVNPNIGRGRHRCNLGLACICCQAILTISPEETIMPGTIYEHRCRVYDR